MSQKEIKKITSLKDLGKALNMTSANSQNTSDTNSQNSNGIKPANPGGTRAANPGGTRAANPGGTRAANPDNEKYTNAGHYFYVKAERDFGRQLPDYTFYEILGVKPKNIIIHDIPYEDYFKISHANATFDLTTVYPGLLIGVGYTHPAEKKNEDENDSDFQIGFYFDWTTGLPVIPGSTVKGILRSVFPQKEVDEEIRKNKEVYLKYILKNPDINIAELQTNIFEYNDIFYDAYIVQPPNNNKIFAEDYLAPHNSPFEDPIPLRFLKIAPGVTFRFQFHMNPYKTDDTEINKEKLFKQILLDFGIGAKRNTGYGILEDKP